jgi:hypothetical protein
MTGTAGQKRVSFEYFTYSPFPLPPVAEQRRIVDKVDELMALCDRLEAARAEREATRDRFTAASLTRLNAPDPDTFRDDARFALDASLRSWSAAAGCCRARERPSSRRGRNGPDAARLVSSSCRGG